LIDIGVKAWQDCVTAVSDPVASPTNPASVVEHAEVLRRMGRTGQQIGIKLRLSPATVSRILRRLGLNRIGALEPSESVRRYDRERPGEMIHIDIKKLGRIEHRTSHHRRSQRSSLMLVLQVSG
jgi:hypothetical protein